MLLLADGQGPLATGAASPKEAVRSGRIGWLEHGTMSVGTADMPQQTAACGSCGGVCGACAVGRKGACSLCAAAPVFRYPQQLALQHPVRVQGGLMQAVVCSAGGQLRAPHSWACSRRRRTHALAPHRPMCAALHGGSGNSSGSACSTLLLSCRDGGGVLLPLAFPCELLHCSCGAPLHGRAAGRAIASPALR